MGNKADLNAKDKKHYTPLHAAAAGGQEHAVKLLLSFGADVRTLNIPSLSLDLSENTYYTLPSLSLRLFQTSGI